MSFIGNLLWIIFGGLVGAISWFFTGLAWCCTIIGIPVGIQCFKIAGLTLCPFGREVRGNGKAGSFILNIFWFFFGGLELALGHAIVGLLFCITIIGIPFGTQHFKLAHLALMPFGTEIH